MCIEAYSREQPILIPFAHERVRFITDQSFLGIYTILIENKGNGPIREICLLYPRPLMNVDSQGIPTLSNTVKDISSVLIERAKSGQDPALKLVGDTLTWEVPDPNRPWEDLMNVSGKLKANNSQFGVPEGFESRHVFLLNSKIEFSAWTMVLAEPILPGESYWLSLAITVSGIGRVIPQSLSGRQVFHQFASPLYVRRTLAECFSSGANDALSRNAQPEQMNYFRSFLDAFGLLDERKVNIRSYQLTVEPGDPMERELTDWTYEGHLWMRSGSPFPRPMQRRSDNRKWTEPVFQWKSGTMVDQYLADMGDRAKGDHPSMDFILRFVLRSAP